MMLGIRALCPQMYASSSVGAAGAPTPLFWEGGVLLLHRVWIQSCSRCSICITANGLRSLALRFRPFILKEGFRILDFLSGSMERYLVLLINDACRITCHLKCDIICF